MKKTRLFLFISIFIIILSSNVLAEEIIGIQEDSHHTQFDKYDSDQISKRSQFSITNIEEDEVYDLIYNAFMSLSDSIDLSRYSMNSDKVFYIRNKVLNDHPEIFYYDYANSYYWTNGRLDFNYIDTKENVSKLRNELNTKVENILSDIISPNMTEFQKELAIHDYIVLNTEYDYENYKNNTIPEDSYTIYGTLIKGTAVCQGYAESFKFLLGKVGIDSIIVSSPQMNHAWNIVIIDGENYQVDVTWNDPIPDRKGKVRYKYLNLTDTQMKKDHNWDYTKYTSSTNSKYSYLWDIDAPIMDGNYNYYSSSEDYFIYRLDENLNKQKITSVKAPYFDIAGENIYFSNYSNGGYLFKISKDGIDQPIKLNDKHSIDIYRDGTYIYYTEKDSGIKKSIKVDIVDSDTEQLFNTPLDKVWTVTFNKEVDKGSINDSSIYILDNNSLNKVELIYEVNGKQVRLVPKLNYMKNKRYTLFITQGVKSDNRNLVIPVEKEFDTYKVK